MSILLAFLGIIDMVSLSYNFLCQTIIIFKFMKKIITFGELLMRLTPPDGYRIGQTNEFRSFYGGSEANVAVHLALYGLDSAFVSLLPDNPVGRDALQKIRALGVNTKWLKLSPRGRMGIYFLEPGLKECSCVCTYDRQNSSIALAQFSDFDWKEIFSYADAFHFSGITPALGNNLADICSEACYFAQKKGLFISCDINYRSKLWSKDEASSVMQKLCKSADILFINEDEASLLGVDVSGENLMHRETYQSLIDRLSTDYPAKIITTAARIPIDGIHHGIQAIMWLRDTNKIYQSNVYPLYRVIDPNGAGDAYAAAFLYGLSQSMHANQIINFAAAASNLSHCYRGDMCFASIQDIMSFASCSYADKVHR